MTSSSRPDDVAVIGAGRMGAGIAHAFLVAGARVDLRDVSKEAVGRGRVALERSVAAAGDRGTLVGEDAASVLNRLNCAAGLEGLQRADLVIEAVPEIPELKADVWRRVSVEGRPDAVLATNTSSLSISELATSVDAPERFLGMHFFNPVPASRLVEVVRAARTGDDVIAKAMTWIDGIGKESIVVADSPGFATSRLGVVVGLEAIRMLEQGVATADDIDRGMVLGYGFPVGPIRLTDIVGLDVRLEIAEYLQSRLGDRFEPPELLRRKVAEGSLGRKTGRGFYEWSVR